MAEGAALLVETVLPPVACRQWVLSSDGPMSVPLGYDAPRRQRMSKFGTFGADEGAHEGETSQSGTFTGRRARRLDSTPPGPRPRGARHPRAREPALNSPRCSWVIGSRRLGCDLAELTSAHRCAEPRP